MAVTTGETDIINPGMGYGGFGGGGFGGLGLVGLIGLNSLWGQNGFGNNGFNNGVAGTTVLEQNVSELRKDVQGVNTQVEALGNEIAGTFFNLSNNMNANFRTLDNQVCGIDKSIMQTAYAQSLQAFQNTQALQGQMTAMQSSNDMQFCAVKELIHNDGDLTRSLITQNLIDGLRNELLQERRGRDAREIEINVSQNSQQTQNQLQAQLQSQNQYLASMFGALNDQVNKATNSVVNLGTMVGSGQSANQTNVKA